MAKSIKHLEAIVANAQEAIQNIQEGGNEQEVLKNLTKAIDKNFIKIVTEFGGESYFYKANNYSAWQLAMGEVT